MQVRFARDRHPTAADDVRELFFLGLPAAATEADVQALFGSHGAVESVTLMQDADSQESKVRLAVGLRLGAAAGRGG